MGKILFSTLGMTDPMKNDYDGPLLHIMRHYRPHKVYLFMTKRVCELADQDNRYRDHINRLCQHLGFDCEIVELRFEEIDKPQLFDIFYPRFEKELIKIHQENPGSEILINLSSGTPQMKSSCQLIALTIGFPIYPIQVTTPNEQENYGTPDFDVKTHWENNIDNDSELEAKNRCIRVESKNLRFLFLREAAISHINSYEYNAALIVLAEVREFISDDALSLLRAAKHRKQMELVKANNHSKLADFELFPIKSTEIDEVKELFEYLLILRLQQKVGDLMDFVRGISPALTRLFELFLQEKCQRRVKDQYCILVDRDADHWKLLRYKLDREKELIKHYDFVFKGEYRDSSLSCASLLPMITFDCGPNGRDPNEEVIKRAKKMRDVEEKIRNKAAHNICAITEKEFISLAKIPSEKLVVDMLWLFEYTYSHFFAQGANLWESYDQMNREIINRLK